MRKLVESTLVSLDGVIGSPDRWSLFDEESSRCTLQELDNYEAFLLGRLTYEYFRNTWGSATGGTSQRADQCDAQTRRLPDTERSDVERHPPRAGPRRRHRAAEGTAGEGPIKWGLSRLDDTLLRAALIDELQVWFMPVVVGTGQRLFEDVDTSSVAFTLTHVREFTNGSVIHTYTPSYTDEPHTHANALRARAAGASSSLLRGPHAERDRGADRNLADADLADPARSDRQD